MRVDSCIKNNIPSTVTGVIETSMTLKMFQSKNFITVAWLYNEHAVKLPFSHYNSCNLVHKVGHIHPQI